MPKAIKEKEKKKFQGGPKRRSYLKQIAAERGGSQGQYMKYGDIPPEDVHEGTASYRGSDYADSAFQDIGPYAVAANRGHGKSYFIFQKRLYKVTAPGGGSYEEVRV